jgi:hypothetical protein
MPTTRPPTAALVRIRCLLACVVAAVLLALTVTPEVGRARGNQ